MSPEQATTISTDVRVRRYAPAHAMPFHSHAEPLMSIVINGSFVEKIGKSERCYAPGHIAYFPPGLAHAQDFGATGARQIIFRPRERWLDYLADCRMKLDTATCASGREFQVLGHRLLCELGAGDALSSLACEGILLETVAAYCRRGADGAGGPRPPQWLLKARDFLNDNAHRAPDLREVARAAGRHEIHLAREFRRYFGMSVTGYLRRLRAERAAHMLLDGKAGLSEIAFACGFSSHSHMSREFKTFYGITPSAFRTQSGK